MWQQKFRGRGWLQGGRDYTASEIREALGMIGPVEDVVVRTNKKRASSALAVMATAGGAQAAIGSISGSLASPLLVVPYRAKVSLMSLAHWLFLWGFKHALSTWITAARLLAHLFAMA